MISTFHSLNDLHRFEAYRSETLDVLCGYELWCAKDSLENVKYILGYLMLCDFCFVGRVA